MHEISKKILDKYQVRKTKKQKTEFIEFLKSELNTEIMIEEGGISKSRNLIIGDLNNSKYILAAHYDTAPELPIPNFLTPKNYLFYFLYMFLIIMLFMAIEIVLQVLLFLFTDNEFIHMAVYFGTLIFMLVWVFVGKANKHTANDNTSGVITLIEALHNEKIKDKVCCVFFDHEEIGLLGSAYFNKKHKKELENKLLFNFDCVSDGDTIMMILSKTALNEEENIKNAFIRNENKNFLITKSSNTIYPSDQKNFKNHVGVAAFKKNKLCGYYMNRIHTKKDIIFDEMNIEMIIKGIENYVSGE